MISVSVDLCSGFHRNSSLVLPLRSITGFSVYLLTSSTESFDEDVEEVGVDDAKGLVDKPGTTNGTSFEKLQSILLPFLVRDGTTAGRQFALLPLACATSKKKRCLHTRTFWTLAGPPPPVHGMPWGPHHPGHRGFFSCLHLAVGRHHRRRTPRCPHGLQLRKVKVFLADHMHTSSGIHHKLSLPRAS